MTQCRYGEPPKTFSIPNRPQPVHAIDVMGEGREALARANTELGVIVEFYLALSVAVCKFLNKAEV